MNMMKLVVVLESNKGIEDHRQCDYLNISLTGKTIRNLFFQQTRILRSTVVDNSLLVDSRNQVRLVRSSSSMQSMFLIVI